MKYELMYEPSKYRQVYLESDLIQAKIKQQQDRKAILYAKSIARASSLAVKDRKDDLKALYKENAIRNKEKG